MYGSPPFIKFSEKYKWNVRTVRGTMGSGKFEFYGGNKCEREIKKNSRSCMLYNNDY